MDNKDKKKKANQNAKTPPNRKKNPQNIRNINGHKDTQFGMHRYSLNSQNKNYIISAKDL